MTDEERISILKLIRQETGCGLKEAEIGLNKLLDALKNKPMTVLDKPSEMVIFWT